MNALKRIQSWYKNQCDGDWEHSYGVRIETLDNPGWSLTIDLLDTSLEGVELEISNEISEFDWFHVKIKDNQFVGSGDPNKLDYLIECFFNEIIPNHSKSDFEYEILIPMFGAPIDVWTVGRGVMKNETEYEITLINSPDSKTMLCETLDNVEAWINDFDKLELRNHIGDIVETELVETFQGTRLGIK
jgi:hypothetical protein